VWEEYKNISYPKISLVEERNLIAKAQKGSRKSKNELVLRHISFLIFRVRRIVFPHLLNTFGEELLQEVMLLSYAKIKDYKFDYRNKKGKLHPVKFSTYIWKFIDGYILSFFVNLSDFQKS
jgi:hypothetical protein